MENAVPVDVFLLENKLELQGKAKENVKWTVRIALLLLTSLTYASQG